MSNFLKKKPSKSNDTKTTMKLFMGFVAILCATLCCQPATADEALSEFWSEADGLSLKYSTHHNDLAGTKGSELTLASDKGEQQQQEPHAAVDAGEESTTATGGGSGTTNEEATGPAESGANEAPEQSGSSAGSTEEGAAGGAAESASEEGANNDQGADSSLRQSEKIPIGGRVQSYALSGGQRVPHKQLHSQLPASLRDPQQQVAASSENENESDDDEEAPKSSSLRKFDSPKAAKSSSDNYARSQMEEFSQSAASQPPPPQSASDENPGQSGDSSEPEAPGAYGNARFRQPSRLFKEAVRMGETQEGKSENGGAEESNNDQESSSGSDESGGGSNDESGKQPGNYKPSQAVGGGGGDSKSEGDESENEIQDATGPSDGANGRRNLQAGNQQSESDGDSAEGFPTASDMELFEGDPLRPRPHGAFHDLSGARAPLASSNKERAIQQQAGFVAAHKHQTSAKPSGSRSLTERPNTHPQAYKQLAYFRGLNGREESSASRTPEAIGNHFRRPLKEQHLDDTHESPDSVRDDFISPGHFPGSMPHLNLAASEIQAASQANSLDKPSAASGLDSKPAESLAVAQHSPASDQQQSSQGPETIKAPDSGDNILAEVGKVSSDIERLTVEQAVQANKMLVTVTPEPAAQEQQIMAPTSLVSTTTMAPMLPTTSTTTTTLAPSQPDSTSRTTEASVQTTPTTTQAPNSLKRFKFRKYR